MQTSTTHHTAPTIPPIGTAAQKPFPARRFTGIFDRYADTYLPRAINEFVGVTVHGVRDLNENIDDETACIVDDVHPHFFSVYLSHESGEEECVGDFSAYKHACEYAAELSAAHQLPVVDGIQTQFQKFTKLHYADYRAGDLVDSLPLSNGVTVFRRMAPNGSKTAFLMD